MDATECFSINSKSSLLITPEIFRKVTPRNGEFQPLDMHARECLQKAGSYCFCWAWFEEGGILPEPLKETTRIS